MASVTVKLPSLLAMVVDGRFEIAVTGGTIREALDDLVRRQPELGVHLFDESGGFREHVLCFHNGTNTRWMDDLSGRVADGDELMIHQAVSGG